MKNLSIIGAALASSPGSPLTCAHMTFAPEQNLRSSIFHAGEPPEFSGQDDGMM